MDLSFWALSLDAPTRIESFGPPAEAEGCPHGLKVQYLFPSRGSRPGVSLNWYDGDRIPEEILSVPTGGGGTLFVGTKGMLRADYSSWKLRSYLSNENVSGNHFFATELLDSTPLGI